MVQCYLFPNALIPFIECCVSSSCVLSGRSTKSVTGSGLHDFWIIRVQSLFPLLSSVCLMIVSSRSQRYTFAFVCIWGGEETKANDPTCLSFLL